MIDLSKVGVRANLPKRHAPYWQKVSSGLYLGYRDAGSGGTWRGRSRDPETGEQRRQSFGDFCHVAPAERFDAALKAVREWADHLNGGGTNEVITVGAACRAYASKPGNAEAKGRFERLVYPDPIARIALPKLSERQVRDYRERLAATPALVTRRKNGAPAFKPRSVATVNRDLVPFRAALNLALADGYVTTDRAWKKALKPERSSGRRDVYLDMAQRNALLAEMPNDIADFTRSLCMLPLRPGALANLNAGDFDARTGELRIPSDKSGGGRKLPMPNGIAVFLKFQAEGKPANAPLFTRWDGARWVKDKWKGPIALAVAAAGLPIKATAYALRHSTITDLVKEGLDLFTVAKLAGTSVAMIERHYGHLQQKHAAAGLERLLAGLRL